MKFTKLIVVTIGVLSLWSCNTKEKTKPLGIQHVVVIGFDGLSPNGLKNAKTPNFDSIIKEGAYTLHARAVLPTSSSSNWASMIMGSGPEQHGITSNQWERNNLILPTVIEDEHFLFPTIFGLIDNQVENAEIGAIYHWEGFGRLFEKKAVDYDVNGKTEDETANLAIEYIKTKKPTFTFIHFDHVDHAGHEFGHGTEEYYKSVEKADNFLGEIINAIKETGIEDNTLVIISADHGGIGKGHGGETLEEIEIPFILWGKSVKNDFKIKYPVYQYDNAATVAFALNIKMPYACIGKPVKFAFEGYEVSDNYPLLEMMEKPIIFPNSNSNKRNGGLFNEETIVKIENPNNLGEIHYTLDGSMPTIDSEKYTETIKVNKNIIVKAAIFNEGKIRSSVAEAFYRIKPANYLAPVSYELYYLENLTNIPNLENKIPDVKGNCFEITSDEINEEIKENTAVKFKTKIEVKENDTYTFFTRSDDGSKLWVNSEEVVNNDGDHGVIEKGGKIELKKGIYPLEVIWFNAAGGSWLDVYYKSNSISKQIISTTILKRND
ncbi:alkaline phosphatase family protein [Lutibacter sp. B1]|uniref:alkaline phosphatase family protein n=1 Tax=Lutibacter sp. B1 TaxID=2725996 RepID=UPI001456365B|nr:alkaline phosphatase family protein [Lutibacter sp. B1]NLP57086.1 sulfatase-like hydrolase/transferase [Lutibacter sp. B1]